MSSDFIIRILCTIKLLVKLLDRSPKGGQGILEPAAGEANPTAVMETLEAVVAAAITADWRPLSRPPQLRRWAQCADQAGEELAAHGSSGREQQAGCACAPGSAHAGIRRSRLIRKFPRTQVECGRRLHRIST